MLAAVRHGDKNLRIIVMGPSGCGKSTIGRALAQSLHLPFVEGDDLHPPANVEKMAAGRPLDDLDRAPWLDAVARAMQGATGVVVACSALKRRYRDQLRRAAGPLYFVLPQVPRVELARRLSARTEHYMPPALLDSQLAELEILSEDEPGVCVDGTRELGVQVQDIKGRLGL